MFGVFRRRVSATESLLEPMLLLPSVSLAGSIINLSLWKTETSEL